ncbi:MAG: NUDIX domain-containing protein [Bacteroides sp.]|nr:NUDIX domain-containing protein [Bacteroides sp.]
MHYKYCPECGAELMDRQAGDDGNVPYCESCGKYWFDSFASCVIVMVVNELDEIALLRQEYISSRHYTFVAGYITPGESAEETAVREVKEELGLEIEKLEYAGTHWFAKREQLMHAYIGYVKKDRFKLSSEVDEALWVPFSEAPSKMFPDSPGNTQHILYRKYLESKS